MNIQEIRELKLKEQEMMKKTDGELFEIKTSLDKAISTLEKKLPQRSFVGEEEYISIAKEIGQKFFLRDKISQILASRGKGKYNRVKEEAIEYSNYTRNKAQQAIEKSVLGAKMGSDGSLSSAQYHLLTD